MPMIRQAKPRGRLPESPLRAGHETFRLPSIAIAHPGPPLRFRFGRPRLEGGIERARGRSTLKVPHL
eukprot:9501059-Pyramimonas_sp.AAC.1